MPLDIHICGAGFGEMILLQWDENGLPRAGLIDGYSPNENVEPLVRWLRSVGVQGFAFMAVTHPHLDHFFNLDALLRAFKRETQKKAGAECVWFWPGVDDANTLMYFDKVAHKFPDSPNQLRKRAKAVKDLFDECDIQCYGNPEQNKEALGEPIVRPVKRLKRIYPLAGPIQRFEVQCIGPSANPSMRFLKLVSSGIAPNGEVTDTHREANLVSAGFLVKFGESQVLLGGDMEDVNWQSLIDSRDCPEFKPCVVKVSHHGSSNGRVDGMWGPDGFLGRHRPIAVVTPWNKALPETHVLDEIQASGCETWLTGQQRAGTYEWLSRIHIRVYEDGRKPEIVFKSPTVKLH